MFRIALPLWIAFAAPHCAHHGFGHDVGVFFIMEIESGIRPGEAVDHQFEKIRIVATSVRRRIRFFRGKSRAWTSRRYP